MYGQFFSPTFPPVYTQAADTDSCVLLVHWSRGWCLRCCFCRHFPIPYDARSCFLLRVDLRSGCSASLTFAMLRSGGLYFTNLASDPHCILQGISVFFPVHRHKDAVSQFRLDAAAIAPVLRLLRRTCAALALDSSSVSPEQVCLAQFCCCFYTVCHDRLPGSAFHIAFSGGSTITITSEG